MITVVSILTAVGLMLGVVSAGMNAKTIYEIESDRSYVAAADKLLSEVRSTADEELAAARYHGDAVAIAQAEAHRDAIRLIERRTNVAAIGRQVEQTKEAFLEEQWRQFQADLVAKGLSAGAGRIGFGKVRDCFMRGTNWPPDPSKSLVLFDPTTRQAVRVILGPDRPVLDVIEFSDDLGDVLGSVLTGYDVMKSTTGTGAQPRTASEALEQVQQGLERLGEMRALPSTVGGYLATSLVRRAQRDNPQIATLSAEEQEEFVRGQACGRLRGLLATASSVERSEAVRAAQEQLGCLGPSTAGSAGAAAAPSAPSVAKPPPQAPTETATPTTVDRLPKSVASTPTSTMTASPPQVPTRTVTPMPMPSPTATPTAAASAPMWVVQGPPTVNWNKDPEEFVSTEPRFIGTSVKYTVGDGAIAVHDRYVDHEFEAYNVTVECSFDPPPPRLVPGETYQLTARFSHGGAVADSSSPGQQFWYSADRAHTGIVAPAEVLAYYPWAPGAPTQSSKTWVLTVPQGRPGDTIEIWASWWNCPPCNVHWTYRLE